MRVQEVNTHASLPFTRKSASMGNAQQHHDEFMSAIRSLQETSLEQKDSMVTILVKWALVNSEEMSSWSHHGQDSQHFLKSFQHGIPSSQRASSIQRTQGTTSFSASQSSLGLRTFNSFGTLASVMIRPPKIRRSITTSSSSTVFQVQST